MTTFDDREKAFENRFVHDQELEFLASARRNRVMAHWVAGLLGKSGEHEAAYAAEILAVALQGGNEAVVAKLLTDLAGGSISETDIRHRMDLEQARALQTLKTE